MVNYNEQGTDMQAAQSQVLVQNIFVSGFLQLESLAVEAKEIDNNRFHSAIGQVPELSRTPWLPNCPVVISEVSSLGIKTQSGGKSFSATQTKVEGDMKLMPLFE